MSFSLEWNANEHVLLTIHMQMSAFDAGMLQCALAARLPLFNKDSLELALRLPGMCIQKRSVPITRPSGNETSALSIT